MIEGLPLIYSVLMIVCGLFSAAMLVWAAARSDASDSAAKAFAAVAALVLIVHGALAWSGFYLEFGTTPPRFVLTAPLSIAILVFLLFALIPRSADPLRILTLLHIVRIPVEITLWGLYSHGQVPKLMTFEGINPDILSGITAPIVALIAFRGGRPRRALLVFWNLAALGLLFNIVYHAILAIPSPLQRYGFDQPNVGVLYFPFVWLPALIVPVVFTAHVWSLRELLRMPAE